VILSACTLKGCMKARQGFDFPRFHKLKLKGENKMPDITMYKGGECEMKETCYRFKAIADPLRQSYFMTPPFYHIEKEYKREFVCTHYWKESE